MTSPAALMPHARHPEDLGAALGDAARTVRGPAVVLVDTTAGPDRQGSLTKGDRKARAAGVSRR